jgi:glucuronosyltransferase
MQGLVLALLITGAYLSSGARILGLFPMAARSHMAVHSALVKELAHRGHEVTVVSPFPEKTTITNYKDITLDAKKIEKVFAISGK